MMVSDMILAMDRVNMRALQAICPVEQQQKIKLLMDYAPHMGEEEVPDPYYGNYSGFETVFGLINEAVGGLLKDLADPRG